MSPTDSAVGRATPTDAANAFSAMSFVISQHLSGRRISMLVQVKAVTNSGGVTAVGTVDVQPMVSAVDGLGTATVPGIIYGMPYLRIQGGTDAVILDPKVGDIGLAVVADRDISAVKESKAVASPASSRQNSFSDGLYLGGFLNGVPTQYVRFSSEGIELVSPTKVHIQAPSIEADASTQFKVVSPDIQLQGAVHVTGAQTNDSTIVAQGDVTGSGTSLHTHKHTGVQTGGGVSGPPQ